MQFRQALSALDALRRPLPKGTSAVDLEGGRGSLCLWILVADRVIEPRTSPP